MDINLLEAYVSFGVDETESIDSIVSEAEAKLGRVTDTTQPIRLDLDADDSLVAAERTLAEMESSGQAAAGAVGRLAVGFSDVAQEVNQLREIEDVLKRGSLAADRLEHEIRDVGSAAIGATIKVSGIGAGLSAIPTGGVNRFTNSVRDANQVSRRANNALFDLVNLADDLQYGFRGAANNIPQTTRSLASLRSVLGENQTTIGALTTGVGRFVAAIPGAQAALVGLGSGGVIAGLSASAGRFEELTDAVGRLGGTASDTFNALISKLSPVKEAIAENLIDPFISATNKLNELFRDTFGLKVDVSGFDGVKELTEQMDEFKVVSEETNPAVLAVQSQVIKLNEGIANGTNDTAQARETLGKLHDQLNAFTTASARNEIGAYADAVSDVELTQFEIEIDPALEAIDKLRAKIREGGQAASGAQDGIEVLRTDVLKRRVNEAERVIRSLVVDVSEVSESEFKSLVSEAQNAADGLVTVSDRIGTTGFDINVDRINAKLQALGEDFDAFQNDAAFSKAIEKQASQAERQFESLSNQVETFGGRVEQVGDTLRDALAFDVDLQLDDAIQVFDQRISGILNSSLSKLDQRLGGINAQVGSQQEQSVLLQIGESDSAANRIQKQIQQANDERNKLIQDGLNRDSLRNDRLSEIRDQLKSGGAFRVTQIDRISL